MSSSPIEPRPGYHETLRQSVGNPAQPDRLTKVHSLPIEHRTRLASPSERRGVYIYFGIRILFGVALLVGGKLLANWRYAVGNWYFSIVIMMGLIYCSRALFAGRSAATRWFIYLVGCPALALPALLFDRPYYDLTLGLVAVALLADRLATHHFYALTSSLDVRPRRRERLAWQNRFSVLDSVTRRVPLYAVAAATPLLLLALILYRRRQPFQYLYSDDLYVLGVAMVIGVFAVLLFEPVVNFLYGQPLRSPLSMLNSVRRAISDWASYNLHNRQLPGVFISPAGPVHLRLHLLFGALLLLAVPLTELTFYLRMFYPADETNVAEKANVDPASITLQPYQEALLEDMNPREREQYLDRLATDATEVVDRSPKPWLDFGDPRTQQQLNDADIQISSLLMLAMSLPVALPILALLGPLVMVPLFFGICVAPAVSRAESEAREAGASGNTNQPLDETVWARFVDLIKQCPQDEDRKSFFLGLNASDDSPVIVPRNVFKEHAHFLGDSGSGKTTLGLAPLISQMIRARDCSVVVIDLKGDDPSLFENARIEAENAGLRFRWFTNELGKATYVFNPLLQRHLGELSLYQRTDLLTASLGLQYGTDYGRGYFSDANAELLYHALRARPHIGSFVELSNVLKQREPFRSVSSQLKMAGSHLAAIVTRLGSTEALNARPSADTPSSLLASAIDMRQPFEEPQVVYFHLSSALGTATSAEIARMAMFSLLSASKFVDGDRKQVFLVVDEFQRAVSNNLELFLQTARSMNIGVILANQALSDLKKPGVDLVSTVRTNTRYRQLFAVGEMQDLQEVIFSSGETLMHSRSWNQMLGMTFFGMGGAVKSQTTSEVVSPRLRVNDLLLASDHPRQSICHVRRGEGFAQYGGMPFVVESAYHISALEYENRKRASWPPQTEETFTPTLASTDPIASEAAPSIQQPTDETKASSAAAKRLFEGLDDHFEEQKTARRRRDSESPTTEDE